VDDGERSRRVNGVDQKEATEERVSLDGRLSWRTTEGLTVRGQCRRGLLPSVAWAVGP
jgi:hypothetical protein